MIQIGDCIRVLATLDAESVDAIVTDPPYHLTNNGGGPTGDGAATPYARARAGAKSTGFMGKAWDGGDVAFRPETWAAVLRVAKPGAYLAAFGGTRTFHRLACAIEDAGWEIRDTLMWVYGSGFPKSKNLSGDREGWGTALKPAWEPIILARKPLIGTVDTNVLRHGTGALNIDGCRISGEPVTVGMSMAHRGGRYAAGEGGRGTSESYVNSSGRWPANVLHDGSDEVLAAFPQAKGQEGPISATAPSPKTSNVYGRMQREGEASADSENAGAVGFRMRPGARRLDEGSAARFFYCAKASRDDRHDGLRDPGRQLFTGATPRDYERVEGARQGNHHPTVKPTELMRWLCRLVTPPGGLVLDPFTGSGSTGRGALLEGCQFVGIELDAEYAAIAAARIRAVQPGLPLG